jgi:hypothetical protein
LLAYRCVVLIGSIGVGFRHDYCRPLLRVDVGRGFVSGRLDE